MARFDKIDASRIGYGEVEFPFFVDIPDDKYWRYNDTDQNYVILVEAILKFKEICEKQKESIEKKKKIINNFYGYNSPSGIYDEAIDAFKNYSYLTGTTLWEDQGTTVDLKKVNKNDTESIENNLETEKTNETTAFTSGEISW